MKAIRAKAAKKATPRRSPRPNKALEAVTQEAYAAYAQSDGRVINRALGLLLHEQAACEEHLAGLRASIIDVQAKKRIIEAKAAGLLQVQARRK